MSDFGTFSRGLSDAFMGWLSSPLGRGLLEVLRLHGLDVRLRADYLNAYLAQGSLARVEWKPRLKVARLSLARAYAEGTLIADSETGGTVSFDVTPESLRAYETALPQLCEAARTRAGTEGLVEEGVVRANQEETPLLVLDRQVAVPGIRGELDVLAVMHDKGAAHLVAVELKVGLDNRIQEVPRQALRYLRMLDPEGSGLREDVATSYQRVCRQMRDLDFKAPSPELIQPEMPVVALVLLVDYKPTSKLLNRALALSPGMDRPVHFASLSRQGCLVLPPQGSWDLR